MAIRQVLLIGFTFAVCGCVGQDVRIENDNMKMAISPATLNANDCRLPAFELVDARRYKGLGWIGGNELQYPELAEWIQSTLDSLPRASADAQPLAIEINRAYIESHPSGHTFQLVLRARAANNPQSKWHVHRGLASGVTWWGNKGEFGNYIKDASNDALTSLLRAQGECTQASK